MTTGRVAESTVDGWRSYLIESASLAVTVIPDRGAEVSSFLYKPTGTELLCQPDWERPGPGDPPLPGSGDIEFLQRYAGGWQELFPNSSDASEVGGISFPFHGEAATAPWSVTTRNDALEVKFESPRTGLELTRRMRIDESRGLVIEERVSNPTSVTRSFTWGHHLVLGAPLIGPGCVLDLPVTSGWAPELPGEHNRVLPTDQLTWPYAAGRSGESVDLRQVPPTEEPSHDGIYLTGLTDGYVAAENAEIGLRFDLTFDPSVFHWVTLWEPLGVTQPPLEGMYGVGIEPWRSSLPLAEAIDKGEALTLRPGADLETQLVARVTPI